MNGQPKISYCEGCSSEITWGVWRYSGKRMPAHEDPAGNLILVDGYWIILKSGQATTLIRYVSHFATCSKAKDFRRERS
jgi:hypothetical protein